MHLFTRLQIASLRIAFMAFAGWVHAAGADDRSVRPTDGDPPATVGGVAATLDLAKFPIPDDANGVYVTSSSLHYQTASDPDRVMIAIADELLQDGFETGDSIATRWATITVTIDDRPATLYLENSLDEKLTHVTMHHHQGVDVSVVPRLQTDGPIDRRVDELYYTTPIGVREGQSILRSKIEANQLEIQRTSTSFGTAKTFIKNGIPFICKVERRTQQEFESPSNTPQDFTSIYIATHGNVAVANLPRPDDFETHVQPHSAILGSHKSVTAAKPNDAVNRAAAELQKAGWTPVDAVRESVSDSGRLLINNGVLVQIGGKAYGPDRTHVDYYLSMLPFDLPAECDKRLIRIDSAAKNLFFTTSAPVNEVTGFYADHLKALGWSPVKLKAGKLGAGKLKIVNEPDHFRQVFRFGQHDNIVLNVRRKGPQTVWAELSPIDVSSAGLVGIPSDASIRVDSESSRTEATAALNALGRDAANELRQSLDGDGIAATPEAMLALMESQLETALGDVPAEQAAQIRKMMHASIGIGVNPSDAATDTTDPTTDSLAGSDPTAADRAENDLAEQRPTPPGGRTAKPTVPADRISAADFPVPEGAQKVSSEFEMITFGVESIAGSAKSIQMGLADLGWKARGEQIIEPDFAYLKYQKGTGTIDASLVLDDRRDPPVHVVIQGDGLWFPPSDEFGDDSTGFDVEMEPDELGDWPDDDQSDDDQSGDDQSGDDAFRDPPAEFEGLALPPRVDSQVTMSSQFRKETTTSIESDLQSIVEFFRHSAADADWRSVGEKIDDRGAKLNFVGEPGEMTVQLTKYDGEIEIHVAIRDTQRAKQHGFVPRAGLAKLMLANASEAAVVVVINGKTYKLDPEQGAADPAKAIHLHVRPGRYNYAIQGTGRQEQADKLRVVVGETWALMVLPEQGHMAEQMY